MKLLYFLLIIPCFMHLSPAQALQVKTKERSQSLPLNLASELSEFIEKYPALSRAFSDVSRELEKLAPTQPIQDLASPLEDKESKLKQETEAEDLKIINTIHAKSRRPLLGLTIITAGLTYWYLKNPDNVPSTTKFDPITIMTSIGIAKSAATLAAAFGAVWMVQRAISNLVYGEYIEREKRIRFEEKTKRKEIESNYLKTAQELREDFNKFTKSLNEALKEQNKLQSQKLDQYRKELDEKMEQFKKTMRSESDKAWEIAEEFEKISKQYANTQNLMGADLESMQLHYADAIRRLKKVLKEIAPLILESPQKKSVVEDLVIATQKFEKASEGSNNLRVVAQTVPSPKISPKIGLVDRAKKLFRRSSSGNQLPGHSRTSSLSNFNVSTINLNNINNQEPLSAHNLQEASPTQQVKLSTSNKTPTSAPGHFGYTSTLTRQRSPSLLTSPTESTDEKHVG